MQSKEVKAANRLKILWIVSFILDIVCSCIYEVFYPPASPFPSVQSAVLTAITLFYFYPLTIAMRNAAKRADMKKLYTFSKLMSIYFSVAGLVVILYIIIVMIK